MEKTFSTFWFISLHLLIVNSNLIDLVYLGLQKSAYTVGHSHHN